MRAGKARGGMEETRFFPPAAFFGHCRRL